MAVSIEIAPEGRHAELLTDDALEFVGELQHRFGHAPRRAARAPRRAPAQSVRRAARRSTS